MFLNCTSCVTNYFGVDSTIGVSGRTVKCAACGHSWFVQPEGAQKTAGQAPAHEVYREKVREQSRRRSRLVALLTWLFVATIFFGLGVGSVFLRNDIVKSWPQSAAAYRQIGLDVNPFGLEFDIIERSRTFNDTLPIVTVSGKVKNVARSDVNAPAVRIHLKDEAGRIVATAYSAIAPSVLGPDSTGSFSSEIEQAPNDSFEIEVSFIDASAVPAAPKPKDDVPATPGAEATDLDASETEASIEPSAPVAEEAALTP